MAAHGKYGSLQIRRLKNLHSGVLEYVRSHWTAFLIATVFVSLLSMFLFVPSLQVGYYEAHDSTGSINAKEAADLENKFRGTLASALGGFVVLLGLWFTFQQITQASRNARAAEESVKITAKARNLDRLTAAIGYMSSAVMSQKIAGVAILGGVGLNDPEDAEATIATLISYLPERIPFRNRLETLPPDVVGAFTQLSRLLRNREPSTDDKLILCGGFDVASCKFNGLFFRHLKFQELNLDDTFFHLCSFAEVDFSESANTLAIKFYECRLTDVRFSHVNLTFAHFQSSRCERCEFFVRDIEGGGLAGASFENCIFDSVSFKNASLSETSFAKCIIRGCDFREAHFVEARHFLDALTLFETELPKSVKAEILSGSAHLFAPPRILSISRRFRWEFDRLEFYKGRDGVYRTSVWTKTTLAKKFPGIDIASLDTVSEHLTRKMVDFELLRIRGYSEAAEKVT